MRKKLSLLLVVCLMMIASVLPIHAEDEQQKFEDYLTEKFVEMMSSDYLTLHFGLKDYEAYGITKPEISYGSCSWDDYERDAKRFAEEITKLESFDYKALSDSGKADYDTYHFYLERMEVLNRYPYFDFWFNAASGVQDNLLTNLTEFVFYRKEDIDDYLTLLETTGDFLDQAMEITKKQASEGYFITDSSLDTVLESMDRFIDEKDNNQLVVIFNNNVDRFEGLSDKEKKDYKERNEKIVFDVVVPGYQKTRDELEALRGSRKFENSVYDMPEGKEYFAEHLKMKSSSNLSPQELFDLCDEIIEGEVVNLYAIALSMSDDPEQVAMKDPEEILEFHRANMDVFPKGPEVSYNATYLDPSVARESTIAYYMEPPIDNLKDNVIKINGDAISDTNELYATLAHEGFPGHLYQITWYLNTNPNPLRTQISTIGYTEGWAMYAEDYAYGKMPIGEGDKEYNRINTTLGYILNASADIAFNGLGYSVDDYKEYLTGLGLTGDMSQDLYDFVCDMPGTIVPYGVGLAQFLRLRNKAQAEMEDNFDIAKFNEVCLIHGDRPFELVEKDVKEYIETGRVNPDGYKDPKNEVIDPGKIFNEETLKTAGGIFLVVVLGSIIAFILSHFAKRKDPFGA